MALGIFFRGVIKKVKLANFNKGNYTLPTCGLPKKYFASL